MSKLNIRRSQLIVPFGPGAIVEQRGQSFVVTTSDIWSPSNAVKITEQRLQRKLRKDYFLSPPPSDSKASRDDFALVARFPKYHFCSKCRKLVFIPFATRDKLLHQTCGGNLVPMRFVTICEQGHLGEVPWDRWAHSQHNSSQSPCNQKNNLYFKSSGSSGGLESLFIECGTCYSKRSLKGILSKGALASASAKCPGGQPWDTALSLNCDAKALVVQKGASNVHFPALISAVDIPPYSDFSFRNNDDLKLKSDEKFLDILVILEAFEGVFDDVIKRPVAKVKVESLCEQYQISIEEFKGIINDQYIKSKKDINEVEEKDFDFSLKEDEYKTFIRTSITTNPLDYLIMRNINSEIKKYKDSVTSGLISNIMSSLDGVFENVVMIEKLRIVTVFKGFYRVRTPKINIYEDNMFDSESNSEIKFTHSNRDERRQWLPAVENFGEGIFFNFNRSKISSWISDSVISRAKKLDVTPLYLLLHTLSHALIRQLSFECGYPAASISERIYHSKEESLNTMAGILIYTYGDSQGSLGGLARQAKPDRFFSLIYNALKSIEWCSNDPLCMESDGQGIENSNYAACHSCVLLPETSCEIYNRFLDRSVLVGNQYKNINGFFENLIQL